MSARATASFPVNRRQLLVGAGASSLVGMLYPRRGLAATGGVLRVRSYSDLQILDPAFPLSAPEIDIMGCIYSRLITAAPGDEWTWMPAAVESIEQLDPLTVSFTLKDQLGFTDGYGQVTADDVKFSLERIADPANESPYSGDWATLREVEVKDTLSGVIHLNEAFAPLWTSTLPVSSGMIVSRRAVTELGGKIETSPVAQSGPIS